MRGESNSGTFWSLTGMVLWALMAINWLGDHLAIVIPVLIVIVVLFVIIAIDSFYTPGGG